MEQLGSISLTILFHELKGKIIKTMMYTEQVTGKQIQELTMCVAALDLVSSGKLERNIEKNASLMNIK